MPWFDPNLTSDEEDYFLFPGGFPNKHKVGRWPHPQTNRAQAGFIHATAVPIAHTAFKRLFCWQLEGAGDPIMWPPWTRFGHWDLSIDAPGFIVADVGVNAEGWSSRIEIKNYDSLPVDGGPGVEILCWLLHDALGHKVTITTEWPKSGTAWRWDTDGLDIGGAYTSTTVTAGFPYPFRKIGDWAMSDCFLFPRDTPPVEGFADFNNVDTSILFDGFTNATNQRIQLEFDVLLRDTAQCIVLGRGVNTTRHADLTPASFVWRTSVILLSPDLPLDEFGTVRVEFNWNDPGTNWKVYWNGALRGSNATSGATSLFFNTMGRHGSIYDGNFEMRNLTLQDTDPASPRLLLSTELQDDACDIGEKTLKGTTENMTLPSCP